jgi:murein DD-endopeptidase MepM/ murein hydrolase activator NlpD
VVILRHEAAPGASFTLPDGGTASVVWSLYGHVDRRFVSSWLRPGDVVRRGQPIGVVGPTPTGSSGPHLHLEVRTMDLGPGDGYADAPSGRVNPITFLAQN